MQVLGSDPGFQVTFLGVTKAFQNCHGNMKVVANSTVDYVCLEPQHFIPEACSSCHLCTQYLVTYSSLKASHSVGMAGPG